MVEVNLVTNISKGIVKKINLNPPTIFINGNIYSNNAFKKETLYFYKNKQLNRDLFLKSTEENNSNKNNNNQNAQIIDLKGHYITPTLIDQHIHGGFGIDFNSSNEEQIRSLLKKAKKLGNGGILATLIPDSIEKLNSQMNIIRNIMKNPNSNEALILGINLEGPFFNPKKAGIHSPNILLKPTIDNVNQLNLDEVKIMTIAPELDDNFDTIKYLNSLGIITSAGHCKASAEEIKNSQVKCITHIFNAMPGLHHREPTIVNEGLFNNEIYTEVNTAFELLSPQTMDLIYSIKDHDKIIFISDSLKGATNGSNCFKMGDKLITIDENEIAKDCEGILAGSIKLMGEVASKIINNTKITFSDFIKFASTNPLNLLKVNKFNYLEPNSKPSFTIWDKDTLKPLKTFIEGE